MRLRTPRDIGLLIRERRRALGLGQAALADRVGVSRQWIIGIEKGKGGAALRLVLRTLDALGIAVYGEEPPSTPPRPHSQPIVDIGEILAAHRGRGGSAR